MHTQNLTKTKISVLIHWQWENQNCVCVSPLFGPQGRKYNQRHHNRHLYFIFLNFIYVSYPKNHIARAQASIS